MFRKLVRSDAEIDGILNSAFDAMSYGTSFPDNSYEEGVAAAVEWLINEDSHYPMESLPKE